ncbi:phosphotransferase family protein [Streptomyces sp. NPDC057682]|uniref:phosphotransferase family protein n=1 Tax=Streptomyces sp. NPDC057682 TaxID=3346210 RepID=UPI0036A3FA35
MTSHDATAPLRPQTLAWVSRHLEAGERVVRTEPLHGGVTADVRRLTIAARDGGTRDLVLRSYVDPFYLRDAESALNREAAALTLLPGTGVPAPALVAADPTAAHCAYPSLLMTRLEGRTVLDDAGIPTRLPLLARHLVAVHALRPTERPPEYVALSTPDTAVIPQHADRAVWSAAADAIRTPRPPYQGRFLHRDFQPGNILFDSATALTPSARITGVIDWAGASWGPSDLDVAHCSTVLALLHGPTWGLRFPDAYESAGGTLAPTRAQRRYWQVRDALAASEEVGIISRVWREAGRSELTERAVGERLHAYVVALMGAVG